MVGIGNGRGIGGGTPLLPHALVDDGLLDVMVSKATGPFARVRFGAALASGEHMSDPQVRFARGRSVTVWGEPVGVNSDGETGDDVRRRTWTVSPGAWTLIRP
jgi:diacylglycerol kinase family enzyme